MPDPERPGCVAWPAFGLSLWQRTEESNQPASRGTNGAGELRHGPTW